MRDDLISLKLVINKMKLPEKINSFQNRLKLQKATYLIQLSGIDLGYRYSWYLRGPYSTALAKDLYELDANSEEYKNVSKKYDFEDEIKSLIGQCIELLTKPSDINLPEEEWYELLASLHYLKHIAFISNLEEKDFEKVYENLPHDKKQRFAKSDARKGWNFLKKFNLIKNKKLPITSNNI